jgi:hypothetical protein
MESNVKSFFVFFVYFVIKTPFLIFKFWGFGEGAVNSLLFFLKAEILSSKRGE